MKRSLKKSLMELGNTLVAYHRYEPSIVPANVAKMIKANSTLPITLFTMWLNSHPEAQEILIESTGMEWETVINTEKGS